MGHLLPLGERARWSTLNCLIPYRVSVSRDSTVNSFSGSYQSFGTVNCKEPRVI